MKKPKKIIMYLCVVGMMVNVTWGAVSAKKPYEGVTLRWLIGTGHNEAVLKVNEKYIKEKLGITIVPDAEPSPTHYALAMRDWMSGGGNYDIVTLFPRWNGEFMGMGYLMPLNDFMDNDKVAWDGYNDIIEKYRKALCEWGGKIYAYVQDGDAAIMYYRKDILGNPEYRAKFKAKYGYDLPVPPKTWKQLMDVADFFNGWDWDGDGEVEYGIAFHPWHQDTLMVTFTTLYMSRSNGKLLFDKDMHPQINNKYGIETLNIMKHLYKDMPPGWLGYTWTESFSTFIEGHVAISLNYGDIGRTVLNPGTFAGSGGPQLKPKIGYSLWPATYHNGKPVIYDPVFFGRIMGIPRFSKHPRAAFEVIKEISRPERKILHCSNIRSGTDIFAYSLMDPKKWTINIDPVFIKTYIKALDYGVPDIMIPSSEQYYRLLGAQVQKFLTGEQDAKTTLARIESDWETATDRLGREKMKIAWESYVKNMVKLGFRL